MQDFWLKTVKHRAFFDLFGKVSDGEIPAGQKAYPFTMKVPVETGNPMAFVPFTLYGVFPHMHLYGSQLQLEVIRSGSTQNSCLMNVPKWNFHRQFSYFYKQPIEINNGDKLVVRCTYDTSSAQSPVQFGEMTADEMCVMGMYLVLK